MIPLRFYASAILPALLADSHHKVDLFFRFCGVCADHGYSLPLYFSPSFRTLAKASNTDGNHAGFWLYVYLDHGNNRMVFTCGGTGEILIDNLAWRIGYWGDRVSLAKGKRQENRAVSHLRLYALRRREIRRDFVYSRRKTSFQIVRLAEFDVTVAYAEQTAKIIDSINGNFIKERFYAIQLENIPHINSHNSKPRLPFYHSPYTGGQG